MNAPLLAGVCKTTPPRPVFSNSAMNRPALFLAASLLAPALLKSAEPGLPPREEFHLFLLVGQSNMAGRGAVAEEDREENPRVLMFDKNNRWVAAVDPMHFDKPAVVGVGPGRTFGLELAKAMPGVTIGLIPCAVGGSPIDTWKPGARDAPTNTHPWDDAMKRAKAALEAGVLKGILWHQGESDSKAELAGGYEVKLRELVDRFRETLAAPDVPFLAGQMGRFPERPWDEHKLLVNQAHELLPKRVARTAFVSAEGLGHKGDEVHFDSAAARELGRRYAAALLKLAK
jgi:hypothetical protein